MACLRTSGAVPSIADLPSWPAQGQVCRKRDVIPVFILDILHLFKDNSSYVDNMWSNGTVVSGVWKTSLQLHGKTEENHEKFNISDLPRFEPVTLRIHCSSPTCSTATFVVEPYVIWGS